jgi:hypothetical protein
MIKQRDAAHRAVGPSRTEGTAAAPPGPGSRSKKLAPPRSSAKQQHNSSKNSEPQLEGAAQARTPASSVLEAVLRHTAESDSLVVELYSADSDLQEAQADLEDVAKARNALVAQLSRLRAEEAQHALDAMEQARLLADARRSNRALKEQFDLRVRDMEAQLERHVERLEVQLQRALEVQRQGSKQALAAIGAANMRCEMEMRGRKQAELLLQEAEAAIQERTDACAQAEEELLAKDRLLDEEASCRLDAEQRATELAKSLRVTEENLRNALTSLEEKLRDTEKRSVEKLFATESAAAETLRSTQVAAEEKLRATEEAAAEKLRAMEEEAEGQLRSMAARAEEKLRDTEKRAEEKLFASESAAAEKLRSTQEAAEEMRSTLQASLDAELATTASLLNGDELRRMRKLAEEQNRSERFLQQRLEVESAGRRAAEAKSKAFREALEVAQAMRNAGGMVVRTAAAVSPINSNAFSLGRGSSVLGQLWHNLGSGGGGL